MALYRHLAAIKVRQRQVYENLSKERVPRKVASATFVRQGQVSHTPGHIVILVYKKPTKFIQIVRSKIHIVIEKDTARMMVMGQAYGD